jgi:hypothetical protein
MTVGTRGMVGFLIGRRVSRKGGVDESSRGGLFCMGPGQRAVSLENLMG